jgi:hypothetical protein
MIKGNLGDLFKLASDLGKARKRGDLEEVSRLEALLKVYEKLMLECDVVVIDNLTRRDLGF